MLEKKMNTRLFEQNTVSTHDNCWAEFSIDLEFSQTLSSACHKLKVDHPEAVLKEPTKHHVSLLYGYCASESEKLMEIVKRHLTSPLTLKAGEIKRGDVSPVILLAIEHSSELDSLFHDLYENIGNKKHTLINGKYDPHITIAWSDQATLDAIDFTKLSNSLTGREFTLHTVFSLDEDKNGCNIVLDELSVMREAPQKIPLKK